MDFYKFKQEQQRFLNPAKGWYGHRKMTWGLETQNWKTLLSKILLHDELLRSLFTGSKGPNWNKKRPNAWGHRWHVLTQPWLREQTIKSHWCSFKEGVLQFSPSVTVLVLLITNISRSICTGSTCDTEFLPVPGVEAPRADRGDCITGKH